MDLAHPGPFTLFAPRLQAKGTLSVSVKLI